MNKVKECLLILAAALLATLIIALGALHRVDKWAQDWLFQRPGVPAGDIIVIGIDDTAFDALGPYYTWDRTVMASALEALAADPDSRPAVVAIDVLYAGNTNPEADERLARAAEDLGCVVTASLAEFGTEITWEGGRPASVETGIVKAYEEPYEALRGVTVQGHINAMVDRDGVLRHALLFVRPRGDGGAPAYSMAFQTARLFLQTRGETLKEPPASSTGHFYVPYTARPGGYYDGVSVAWLIQGKVPAGYWKDKIVLIGPCAPALQDTYFTSIDKGAQMYGVEFQANVIQSLIEGRFKTEVEDPPQLFALFLLCLVGMALFLRLKMAPGAGVCAGLALLGFGGALLLYEVGYVVHPLWLAFAAPALYVLSLVVHYLRVAKERQALALEKERIGAELALATRIQANALPKTFPPFPDRHEFDIYASMTPAKEVGGDLYDFFMIDDDHLALTIGDVSGKGVPAALFMMVAMTLIHHVAASESSPARILEAVNREICSRNPEEMFVTVWLGVLEISTGRLVAANAGHEYPALMQAGQDFDLVKDRHGFVIGGMDGVRYREYELTLTPGSKLFVYTDGVAEATNAAEELFGTDRMLQALKAGESGSPDDVLASVNDAVQAFVGSAPQFDDLTMLCLQYNGPADPA